MSKSFPPSDRAGTGGQNLKFSEWAGLQTHLLWVYDAKTHFPGNGGYSANEFLSAWLIRKGSVTVRIGAKETRATAGQWIFLGQERRWQRFSKDCHLLSLRFKATWPSGEDIFDRDLCLTLRSKEAPQLEKLAAALHAAVRRHFRQELVFLMQEKGSVETYFSIHQKFCEWFPIYVATLLEAGCRPARMGQMDDRILKVSQTVAAHPLDLPFDGKALARSAGLSGAQLNRLFVKQFGDTVRQAFEKRRLEHAVQALRGSPAPIKQISYDLGFGSLAHFSNWFMRKKGLYPHAYRKSGSMFF